MIFPKQCLNQMLSIFLLVQTTILPAEVVLDGTLGPTVALQGPHFDITADLGQQKGDNLFHSFERFNLNKEEIATFSGPDNITNIIGRVTGGNKSIIDGKLHSKIPQANLYLLNPDGFLFGPNARLDVQGSFYLSTASQLRLGESGQFETRSEQQSILVSAPPSAFGFLDEPASIEIRESNLATRNGQTLSMLGGDLKIDGGHLGAISGRINLAAIANTNQLKITPHGLLVDVNTRYSNIELKNNASVNVGKQGSGDIYIKGGQFVLDHSDIIANTEVDKSGGLIDIDVNDLHLKNEADIDSRVFGPGQGGQIIIKVSGNTILSEQSQIRTSSLSGNVLAGDAGNIFLETGYLNLESSTISTTTSGPGQGGNITIKAFRNITLIGTADFPSAIQATSEPKQGSEGAGDAGHIFIKAKDFSLSGTSKIDNSTLGSGRGGSITLEIDEQLRLTNRAFISADSKGIGNAGSIYIGATILDMDRGTISTATDNAEGGNIIIDVHSRLQMNSSLLSATVSGGQGNGGNLAIGSPRLVCLTDSKVIANASDGNGGNVLIFTGTPIESRGSLIEASSKGGLEGKVKIDDIYSVDIDSLPIEFLDVSNLITQSCTLSTDTQSSTFFVTGRGGLPNAPDDLQTYIPMQ
jgi:filamentous hemagglutinin family protein